MSSQDNDQDIRVVAAVLISAILLAVGLAVGIGISKSRGGGNRFVERVQRAFAVRDALKGAGVDEASLELKKPEETAGGTGSNAEARRVEVVIAP